MYIIGSVWCRVRSWLADRSSLPLALCYVERRCRHAAYRCRRLWRHERDMRPLREANHARQLAHVSVARFKWVRSFMRIGGLYCRRVRAGVRAFINIGFSPFPLESRFPLGDVPARQRCRTVRMLPRSIKCQFRRSDWPFPPALGQ